LDTRQQSARLFGDRLRREREMRGVSLDEIAVSTKIGTRLLKALEEEQFDLLPGGIFNKGFVRAYAKYLGMDEEQAVADYLQAAGNLEPDVFLVAQQNDRVEYKYAESESSTRRGFPFMPVLLLLLVVAVGFGGWKLYQQHMQEREAWRAEREASTARSPTGNSPQVTSSDAGQGSNLQSSPGAVDARPSAIANQPSSTVASNGSPATPSSFEVVVTTTGRAWVSLKADGKIEVRGILDADQVKTLHANQEVVVWTGNAGSTKVSFEGKPVPLEGGVNEARVLVFKPNGLQPAAQPAPRPAAQAPTHQPAAEPSPTPQ
jgi:cytoskeleton protein RodZ